MHQQPVSNVFCSLNLQLPLLFTPSRPECCSGKTRACRIEIGRRHEGSMSSTVSCFSSVDNFLNRFLLEKCLRSIADMCVLDLRITPIITNHFRIWKADARN